MHWSYCSLAQSHRCNVPALSHWNAISRFASGAARGTWGNLPRRLAQVWGVLLSTIPRDLEMVAPSRRKLSKRRGEPCPPGYNHKVRQSNWTRCLVAHAPTMAVSYCSRHAYLSFWMLPSCSSKTWFYKIVVSVSRWQSMGGSVFISAVI